MCEKVKWFTMTGLSVYSYVCVREEKCSYCKEFKMIGLCECVLMHVCELMWQEKNIFFFHHSAASHPFFLFYCIWFSRLEGFAGGPGAFWYHKPFMKTH